MIIQFLQQQYIDHQVFHIDMSLLVVSAKSSLEVLMHKTATGGAPGPDGSSCILFFRALTNVV